MTPVVAVTSRPAVRRRRGRSRVDLPLAGGVLALTVATLAATTALSPTDLFVFDNVVLAALGAIALTVLIGTAGQVSIGSSAFLAVGSFSSVFVLRAGVPSPLDIVAATLISTLIGAVVGLPGVRLRGLELALATLATFFIVVFATNQYQVHTPGADGGFTVNTLFGSKGFEQSQVYWAWLLLVILVCVTWGARRLSRCRAGRALRMIRDHELVAPTLGVPVLRYKLITFALSSGVLGLAGALDAHFLGTVTSDSYSLTLAVQYLAMVVIGGLGSITGAIVGAAVITSLPTLTLQVLPGIVGNQAATTDSPQVASIIYFAVLLVFLAFAPGGVAGWAPTVRRALQQGCRGPLHRYLTPGRATPRQ